MILKLNNGVYKNVHTYGWQTEFDENKSTLTVNYMFLYKKVYELDKVWLDKVIINGTSKTNRDKLIESL